MNLARLAVRIASGSLIVAVVAISFAGGFGGINTDEHRKTRESLNALRHLNMALNETILKLRTGLLNNADPLVKILRRLEAHAREVEGDSGSGRRADLDAKVVALSDKLAAKKALVERFTYHNALLENSLLYLPRSIEAASDVPGAPTSVRADLYALYDAVLKFHVRPTEAAQRRGERAVENVRGARGERMGESLANVVRHAENVLHHQREVDALVRQLTTGEDRLLTAGLAEAYENWIARELQRTNLYRFILLLAMLALVAYAAWNYLLLRDTAARLDSSETKYRSMVSSLAEGLVVQDKNGRIVECNASAARILGVPVDALEGNIGLEGAGELLREDGTPRPEDESPTEIARRTGELIAGVVVGLRKSDETLIWLSVNAQPARWDEKQPPGFVIVSFSDITAQKRAQESLAFWAHHDPLSGLPNRMLFVDRFQTTIARARRHGTGAAVLFIDLDDFKRINDSLGHAVGDSVLKTVAERLQGAVRKSDTVARIGGDEFIVLADELTYPGHAASVASKLLEVVEQPLTVAEHQFRISASIGIGTWPDDGEEAHTLIKNADSAMYAAKRGGQSGYRFFSAASGTDGYKS